MNKSLVVLCLVQSMLGPGCATGPANKHAPANPAEPRSAKPVVWSGGYARAPEGAFEIKRAPAPLYRDPIFDGAADPSVVYEPSDGSWLIYYTQRRANVPCPGVSWCFGCKIGIARSTDKGRHWFYVGTAKGLARGSDLDTFWAPHVFKNGSVYHMFVTRINGISTHWGTGSKPSLLHYTSDDGLNWHFSDVVNTGSDNIIDAAVARLPDRRWLLVFRDDNAGTRTALCVSTDLKTWHRLPQTVGDRRHEAPVILFWKDKYWLIVDDWQGLGIYVSDDGLTYKRNGTILSEPGRRRDDGVPGRHAGVATVGDRAFIFYFVHPDRRPGVEKWQTTNTYTYQYKRSSLQVAELELVDGKLTCNRDKYAK